MKIKTITTLGLAAAFLIPASAMAQSFTTESTRTTQTTFGGSGDDSIGYFGSHATGKSTATMADGTIIKGEWECVSMSQPPGIFKVHIICENTSKNGNFTSVFGCNPTGEDGKAMNCMGGMRGKSGDFEGKTGTSSFHLDGENTKGAGQWN